MLLLLALAFAACDDEELGSGPPFLCDDGGACPSGYKCAQRLCIADNGKTPPLLVASGSLDDGVPLALSDGSNFYVLWQDSTSTQPHGLYFAPVANNALGGAKLVLATATGASFNAVFNDTTQTQSFVLAAAINGVTGSELDVVDVDLHGNVVARPPINANYSPFGFSAPALASSGRFGVTVTYTLGDPPQTTSDNLFCEHFTPPNGAINTSCGPPTKTTAGDFISNVVVGAFSGYEFFVWRGESSTTDATYGAFIGGGPLGAIEHRFKMSGILSPQKIVVVNPQTNQFAMTWLESTDGGVAWALGLWNGYNHSMGANIDIESSNVTPDIDGVSVAADMESTTTIVVCKGEADGSASIVSFMLDESTGKFVQDGAGRPLPRYSTAPVDTCKLVIATATNEVGVVWRERIPPSDAATYFTTLPLMP